MHPCRTSVPPDLPNGRPNPHHPTKHQEPDFVVATVIERPEGERDRWVDIGVAFHNPESDTYTVQLDAAPLNGKLVL